jgi:hypothetical protein
LSGTLLFSDSGAGNKSNQAVIFHWMKSIRLVHRGIAYTVVLSEKPDRWTWRFAIGNTVKSGKVTAKLDLYARRLVQQRIDQELRRSAKVQSAAE